MKIKDIVTIIETNNKYTNKIVSLHNKLNSLSVLDINGKIPNIVKEITPAIQVLIDNDNKIIKYTKPQLDETIKEYKDWLEQEI